MFELLSPYHQFQLSSLLITLLMVLSVSMLFEAGIFSLAVGGVVAIGGYGAGLLSTRSEMPLMVGLVAPPVLAALVSLLLGMAILRLRGIYLALGTFAFAQLVVIVIANWSFAGAVDGIVGIGPGLSVWSLLGVVVVICTLMELVRRSRFGRATRAIRLDERTAAGVGVDARRYRLVLFTIAGALAAFAGACDAHLVGVVSSDQYGFSLLVTVFAFALIGGTGHWLGPVAATICFTLFRQSFGYSGSGWEQVGYGAALVVIMLVAPNGLSDPSLWRRLRSAAGGPGRRRVAASSVGGTR